MRSVRSRRAKRSSRGLRRRERAWSRAAARRPRADPVLPAHALEPHWPAVPLSAELLGLCGCGDRAARPLGGLLDGGCARLPLPPVGRRRLRSAARSAVPRRLVGSALALWALAPVVERGARASLASPALGLYGLALFSRQPRKKWTYGRAA